MAKNELRAFIEHWNGILKQQEAIQPKNKKDGTSFFTDTKNTKGGPDKALVEGWHKIMGGAEDYDSDYRSDIKADELAADEGDGWISNNLDDYGPPPTGRASGEKEDLVLQESFHKKVEENHWQKLAKNLKLKEGKSVKGSGFVNTSDAAALLEMSMEHFLRCVWKVPGFVKPEPFREGMAYKVSKIKEIRDTLLEAAEHKGRSASPPKQDDEEEGFGTLVRGDKQMTKGDITYTNEPTTWWSIGPDAAPYDKPVRVSKFSTSEEIDEVAEMKRRLEIMERRVHKADVEGDKAKRDKLVKEVAAMRKKINKMSDDMQSHADRDVT